MTKDSCILMEFETHLVIPENMVSLFLNTSEILKLLIMMYFDKHIFMSQG